MERLAASIIRSSDVMLTPHSLFGLDTDRGKPVPCSDAAFHSSSVYVSKRTMAKAMGRWYYRAALGSGRLSRPGSARYHAPLLLIEHQKPQPNRRQNCDSAKQ